MGGWHGCVVAATYFSWYHATRSPMRLNCILNEMFPVHFCGSGLSQSFKQTAFPCSLAWSLCLWEGGGSWWQVTRAPEVTELSYGVISSTLVGLCSQMWELLYCYTDPEVPQVIKQQHHNLVACVSVSYTTCSNQCVLQCVIQHCLLILNLFLWFLVQISSSAVCCVSECYSIRAMFSRKQNTNIWVSLVYICRWSVIQFKQQGKNLFLL